MNAVSLTAPHKAPLLPCLYTFSEMKEDFIVNILLCELNDGAMRLYFEKNILTSVVKLLD